MVESALVDGATLVVDAPGAALVVPPQPATDTTATNAAAVSPDAAKSLRMATNRVRRLAREPPAIVVVEGKRRPKAS